jgi:hypothetical protein
MIAFVLPILLLVILYPVNKRYRYQYLSNDCFNHALWIYDRIYKNSAPVEIALFGSSHTINGINDEIIEKQLTDTALHVANFGYCRLGTNLYYVLLKEFIRKKNPKYVILEVRGDEDWFSHPIFPYLADNVDVYFPKLLVNRKLFHDYYVAFTYKIQILQDMFFHRIKEAPVRKEAYGFSASADIASINMLDDTAKRRLISQRKMGILERNFQMKYPRSYLKKFAHLCRQHDITIYFLYLPHYAARYKQPLELKTYLQYGMILYPPDSLMKNGKNWHDDEHLNLTGSGKLSLWLAEELNDLECKR